MAAYRSRSAGGNTPSQQQQSWNFNALANELIALAEAPSLTTQQSQRRHHSASRGQSPGLHVLPHKQAPAPQPTAGHLKSRAAKFRAPNASRSTDDENYPAPDNLIVLRDAAASIFASLGSEDDDKQRAATTAAAAAAANAAAATATAAAAAAAKAAADAKSSPATAKSPAVSTSTSQRVTSLVDDSYAEDGDGGDGGDGDANASAEADGTFDEYDPDSYDAAIANGTAAGATEDDSDSDVYGPKPVGRRMRWRIDASTTGGGGGEDGDDDDGDAPSEILDLSGGASARFAQGSSGSASHRSSSGSPFARRATTAAAGSPANRRASSQQRASNPTKPGATPPSAATTGAANNAKSNMDSKHSTGSNSKSAVVAAMKSANDLKLAALTAALTVEKEQWAIQNARAREASLKQSDADHRASGGVNKPASTNSASSAAAAAAAAAAANGGSTAGIDPDDILSPFGAASAHPQTNPTLLLEMERQLKEDLQRRIDGKLSKLDSALKGIDEKSRENLLERQKATIAEQRALRDLMAREQKARELEVSINLQKHAEQRMLAAHKEARDYADFLFTEQKKKDAELKLKLEAAEADRARLEAERKVMLEEKKKADDDRAAAEEARKKAEEEVLAERKKAEDAAAELAKANALVAAGGGGGGAAANVAKSPAGASAPAPAGGGALAGKTIAHAGILDAAHRLSRLDQLAALAAPFEAEKSKSLLWRMKIANLVQQISSTGNVVRDKAARLVKLITEAKGAGNSAYAFTLLKLADLIVSQGEGRVATHSPSAFGFGYVAAAICVTVPDFTPVLVGQFHRRCIYTIPQYLSNDDYKGRASEYKTALGYAQVAGADGKQEFESEERYFERMSGFVTLYAAFMQTAIERHPFGITQAWTWLARMCNMSPKTATAACLIAFLNTSGFQLLVSYSHQFPKILAAIGTKEYIEKFDLKTEPRKAARIRLVQWLTKYMQDGRTLTEPDGRSMPATTDGASGLVTVLPGDEHGE